MSGIEHWKGKLTPVEMRGSVEDTAKLILEEENIGRAKYNETYLEELEDSLYKEYITLGDKIYKITKEKQDPYADIFDMNQYGEELFFEIKYHNGGCGFNEAIEESYKGLKE